MSYFNACLPVTARVPDGSGLSLTRASFEPLTPDAFAALGNQEDLQRVYAQAAEIRMRGYNPSLIDKVLWGRMKDYKAQVSRIQVGPQSIIQPFVTFKQRGAINSGTYEIESGVDQGDSYRWVLTVKNISAAWQKATPRIDTQFQVGNTIVAQHLTPSGASITKHLEITAVADATVGNTAKATITVKPLVSSATFAGYSSPVKATFRPVGGIVMLGTNRVSDYKSWAPQPGVYNNLNLRHFWFQTSRKVFTTNDAYEQALKAEHANEFFKTFGTLSNADRIKQYDIKFQRELATTAFWGQPLEGQDPNGAWKTALPAVTDPDGGETLEYEAQLEGIEYQLDSCGRVVDMLGAPLNFDTLEELLYGVKRNRQESNITSDTVFDIDMGVDMKTAAAIKKTLADAYKKKYGLSYTQELGRGQNEKFAETHGIAVNSYDFEEWAFRLNVMTDPFFYELTLAQPAGHRRASRYAFVIDWSDIDWFTVKTNSRDTEFPPKNTTLDSTRYVIEMNHKRVRMESMTHGIKVNVPERSLILKGFSDGCPQKTVAPCSTYEG